MADNLPLTDGVAPRTPPPAPSRRERILTVAALVVLYLLGLGHWYWFYNGGDLQWTVYDWPKEYAYYHVIREALRSGEVPYHISEYFNGTNRFLAMPETNLMPQVLLLPLMTVSQFIVFDLLLMYSLGFLGCLLIRRRYRLGLVPFAMLFLLFLGNGYITSRMAVGHSMWTGYFLLPFFGLQVLGWQEEGPSLRRSLWLAVVLFAMMLHGAFHMVNWCWLFLALVVAFHPRQWKFGLIALAAWVGLSLFRLLPGFITFHEIGGYMFLGGYQSLTHLIEAMTVLHTHTWKVSAGEQVVAAMGWWEYDLYIGPLGFVALLFLGIVLRFSKRPELLPYRYPGLDGPLLIMTLLSIGFLHYFIATLPLPLAGAERITTRFVTIPFVLLLFISVIRLQRLLEHTPLTSTLIAAVLVGLVETAMTLGYHSYLWQLPRLEEAMPVPDNCYSAVIDNYPDPGYIASVKLSSAVSLLSLIAVAVLLWRTSPERQRGDRDNTPSLEVGVNSGNGAADKAPAPPPVSAPEPVPRDGAGTSPAPA